MIRGFHWTDIPDACAIEAHAFPDDTWSAESFWGELARTIVGGRYFAADDEAGTLLGYAGVAFTGDDAHLQTLAVAEQARGKGVGAQLLGAVLAEAADRNADRCLLEVRADNTAALHLYTGAGFERLGTRPGYYVGGGEALVLEKVLSGEDVQEGH
ncbi:MAG: ribosomal protein S18-alanine N-acetyltransferase [Candidatus Nanopelagicales bacterium]